MIDEPLQPVHAGDVGFRFFESGVRRSDRFANVNLFTFFSREGRSQSVRDLMHHHGGEITFRARLLRVTGAHDSFREWKDDVVHARVHEVLEEDFLAAHFLVDARIVRQVVGDGLIAVPQIAGAERRIHHLHRRGVALLRRTIFSRERQRVLNVGNVLLKDGELLAFRRIAYENRGAV